MENAEAKEARRITKLSFEAQLGSIITMAKAAGFVVTAMVSDPVEEAMASKPLLVDAGSLIRDSAFAAIEVAETLGYNLRIDRKVNPLKARDVEVEVVIWPRRNAEGNYDA